MTRIAPLQKHAYSLGGELLCSRRRAAQCFCTGLSSPDAEKLSERNMVKRLLQLLDREQRGLHEAAYLLGFFALLSQLLGFLRDRLLAAEFGAGAALDVYYAAFRVPDFIFIVSASAVSLSVIIPFLSRKMAEGKDAARAFLDSIFTAFFLCIIAVSVAAFFAAPFLAVTLFPGFSEGAQTDTALLMRIMLLQPILLGLSNLFASVTQLSRRFLIYAVSPLLYNAGIIAGILFLYPVLGISGLAWGVVLGALLHFLIQIPAIMRQGFLPWFMLRLRFSELREVLALSLPRTLALSAQNISVLALTALGSLFGVGSIAVFNFAWNLQSVPLAIVGASYSLAAFPTLAGLWSAGAREKFLETVSASVRHILFWSLPALVLFIVLRAQIVRTVLGAGAFDWADTRLTAAAVALFAVSVAAQSLSLLFTRAYYAAGKTKVPVVVSLFGAAFIIGFSFLFVRWFAEASLLRYFIESLLRVSDIAGTEVLMLPLAYSLGVSGSAIAFWLLYERQFARMPTALRSFWQSFAASVIMGFVAYLLLNVFDDVFALQTALGIFSQGLLAGLGGIAVGATVLYFLGSQEIREVWRTLHHKIWKAKVIGPDPTDTAF